MKIQKQIIKILPLFVLCFFNVLFIGNVYAQAQNQDLLRQADSLFAEKQFTESIKLYEQLYQEKSMASPAMLLKMAFVQEGLGEYSQALYYLSEYYTMTSDEAVVEKIKNMSEEHNLRGYDFSDADYIKAFLYRYQYFFIYFLLGLSMAGLAYFIFIGRKQVDKPLGFGISYFIVLALLFYLTNFSLAPDYGIIVDSNTYIMTAPSAGSDVINISTKGHRVKVSGQEDVWAKIEWNGETAYIRQDNLRLLRH